MAITLVAAATRALTLVARVNRVLASFGRRFARSKRDTEPAPRARVKSARGKINTRASTATAPNNPICTYAARFALIARPDVFGVAVCAQPVARQKTRFDRPAVGYVGVASARPAKKRGRPVCDRALRLAPDISVRYATREVACRHVAVLRRPFAVRLHNARRFNRRHTAPPNQRAVVRSTPRPKPRVSARRPVPFLQTVARP